MDIFELDTVKVQKAMAMRKYKMAHYVAKLFRFVEASLLLFFLFPWFSSRLPAAARATGHCILQSLHALASPKFVFIVGNAIVVMLLAKSGLFGRTRCLSGDLYDEFVRCSSDNTHATGRENVDDTPPIITPTPPSSEEKKGTVCEDEPVRAEESTRHSLAYRRSVSEKRVDSQKVFREELRRSEAETVPRVDEIDPPLSSWSYDESYVSILSNEEFQRTIDAFIEKQIRFRRQESMALVFQGPPNSDCERSSSSSSFL